MQRPNTPVDSAAGSPGALGARGQVALDRLPALLEPAHRSAQGARRARGAQALPGFPPLWRSDTTTESNAKAIMAAEDARGQAAHNCGQTMSAQLAARAGQGDAVSAREGQRTGGGESWVQRAEGVPPGGAQGRDEQQQRKRSAVGEAGAQSTQKKAALGVGSARDYMTRRVAANEQQATVSTRQRLVVRDWPSNSLLSRALTA